MSRLAAGIRVTSRGGARSPIDEREQALILEALKKGERPRKIADCFGRSEGSVRYVGKKNGVKLSGGRSKTGTAKKLSSLTLKLPGPAIELLQAAARRRSQNIETLTANVVVGVLMRGSIDKPPDLGRSLRMAARYGVETDDGDDEEDEDEDEKEDCALSEVG